MKNFGMLLNDKKGEYILSKNIVRCIGVGRMNGNNIL